MDESIKFYQDMLEWIAVYEQPSTQRTVRLHFYVEKLQQALKLKYHS